MLTPLGTYNAPIRRTGSAAFAAPPPPIADNAGTIAFRNGSASVTPAPRRNVRLGMDIFEMNMGLRAPSVTAFGNHGGRLRIRHALHLEGRALDNVRDEIGEAIVVNG